MWLSVGVCVRVNDECVSVYVWWHVIIQLILRLLTCRHFGVSLTEWNLFIIPNVMVSSLRAFFSSLSISVPLIPNLLPGSVRQHCPYFLHLYPSFTLSLIPHSCLVFLLSILSWSSGLHYSASIFHFSPLAHHFIFYSLSSSCSLSLSLSLSCSYHPHIFSFFAHLFFIPSISERISQKRQEQDRVIFHPKK